uniref:Phytocyanin domain-containing protein n=1 Tax=Kalanchoe fedtschenkoi TaxID=63787 RepID=A0A7N0TFH8_KALFE
MATMRYAVRCLAVAAMLMTVAKAETYTVGDTDGWSSGVEYTAWVSGKSFKVGDNLVFRYLPNHDVLEVSKADYDSCSPDSPINSDNSGSTTISLKSIGKRYFICGTIGHCDQGMKLAVDTLGSSSSPPPPAATPPPAISPPSPATPPPAASPPPSSPATPPPAATPPSSSTPDTPPTTTPASPPVSSPPPKTSSPNSAPTMSPPAKSPTGSPNTSPGVPPPPVSKVTPTPQPSSGYKISYGASFAFALIILAAI